MIHTMTNELHKVMNYKTINARFSSEIVTNQATVTHVIGETPTCIFSLYYV